MKLKYNILLYSTNHITGNLIRLKLKSYGHGVQVVTTCSDVSDIIASSHCDLVIFGDFSADLSNLLELSASKKIPVIFIENKKLIEFAEGYTCIKLSFTEEELLHKFSYLTDGNSNKSSLSLLESIIQHYGGDKELSQKVSRNFLEIWLLEIEKIKTSFGEEDDKLLAGRLHSFKGVLSALGETAASALVRKMEILVKGRRRERAFSLFSDLNEKCLELAREIENSTLLSENKF